MLQQTIIGNVVAMAIVQLDGEIPAPVFVGLPYGIASVVETGVGVFELELDDQNFIDGTDCAIKVTSRGTEGAAPTLGFQTADLAVDDQTITVRLWVAAGTPLSYGFNISIERFGA